MGDESGDRLGDELGDRLGDGMGDRIYDEQVTRGEKSGDKVRGVGTWHACTGYLMIITETNSTDLGMLL